MLYFITETTRKNLYQVSFNIKFVNRIIVDKFITGMSVCQLIFIQLYSLMELNLRIPYKYYQFHHLLAHSLQHYLDTFFTKGGYGIPVMKQILN